MYRLYESASVAATQSAALWVAMCESRGVSAAGIAAGTETLDTHPSGALRFPPITTGAVTSAGPGASDVVSVGAGPAVLEHKPRDTAFDGTVVTVRGRRVTVASAVAVDRAALPAALVSALNTRDVARGLR